MMKRKEYTENYFDYDRVILSNQYSNEMDKYDDPIQQYSTIVRSNQTNEGYITYYDDEGNNLK